jgi:predicted NUDIX family NTP pyrophosphohydrolase
VSKTSAGILLFRRGTPECEVFLVHPGGPFWNNKDASSWSIPKGEYTDGEDPLAAAKREFAEETGVPVDGDFVSLGEVKQSSGKVVTAWALEHDLDASSVKSNTFELEWPPKSGCIRVFSEIDKGEWFSLAAAKEKILSGQLELLRRLAIHLETHH